MAEKKNIKSRLNKLLNQNRYDDDDDDDMASNFLLFNCVRAHPVVLVMTNKELTIFLICKQNCLVSLEKRFQELIAGSHTHTLN